MKFAGCVQKHSLQENAYGDNPDDLAEAGHWFTEHVSLGGEAYTLDADQVRAVVDSHKNTLVTARAGSGKTRVIVAKVAYLVARKGLSFDEIAIFMFNRAAAAEVNQRIGEIKVDDISLPDFYKHSDDASRTVRKANTINVASTFHKFALDLVKASGESPQILNEAEHDTLVRQAFSAALKTTLSKFAAEPHVSAARHHARSPRKISPNERRELLQIASGFIARAGQKYPGAAHLERLQHDIQKSLATVADPKIHFYHRLSYQAYANYLSALQPPKIDFNLLMSRAAEILDCEPADYATAPFDELTLSGGSCDTSLDKSRSPMRRKPYLHSQDVRNLKYLMVDEYQDFSYLFFNLVCAIRRLAPAAKLFAVGDDWQAINRFAGSDVDYFQSFATYSPEDYTNISLATNYRSARGIVERANHYMLKNYDPTALPARAFSHKCGKITHKNPAKIRFDATDLEEDCLGDGRFQLALAHAILSLESPADEPDPGSKTLRTPPALHPRQEQSGSDPKTSKSLAANLPLGAAKLLKQVYKIIKHHRRSHIMLLHRHNFTTFDRITLKVFTHALCDLLTKENIMLESDFARQVRCMTMHKSKGLESEVVILLEVDRTVVHGQHPHAAIFQIFGDSRATELADQQRLLYVALTRAKQHLYILSSERKSLI